MFVSSGLVQPPFVHNGFTAELEFVAVDKSKKSDSVYQDSFPKSKESRKFHDEKSEKLVLQQDEAVISYIRPTRVIQQVTRPNQLSNSLDMSEGSKTFKCRDEITGSYRSGLITSSLAQHSNSTCSIVFRGEERDLVLIRINSLQLR